MSRAPLLLVGGAFVLLHTSAVAVPAQPAERRLPRDAADDGLTLLEQAATAARNLSYRGTQMVSFWSEAGSSSALIDVAHDGGKGLLLRVAPTPQNPGGAVYDDESGDVPEVVGFSNAAIDLLATHYDVGVEGSGEVAGRPAYVVTVRRGVAPAARFWIDRATKLPLRREVLDEAGRTIRASAFIQLRVGPARVSDVVIENAAAMPAPRGVPAPAVEHLRGDGWHAPDRLPSGLELVDARMTGAGDAATVHLTYSDGLSTVSLFQQKGVLDEGSVAGWRRTDVAGDDAWVQDAFPRRVVWAGAGVVFTVVADCPQAALDDLVGTLPHGNPGPGIMTRMGNGLARVASWVNPFG
ncbi:MAG TPA: sigma-E factor regulatory protein RseB domain-containing protein [Frankiaceae bacterium]|nr:sigma-E factor regulatory protein RseB domain-containing protein [Frankiaceae bacterium]